MAKGDTISCCVKFKFAIWLLVVVLLVRRGARRCSWARLLLPLHATPRLLGLFSLPHWV